MPMELDVIGLSNEQREDCERTISPNTFFMLVADALVSKRAFSVVRMGDGEKSLYLGCQNNPEAAIKRGPFGEEWLRDFGCYGIPSEYLAARLKRAAEDCTYFAPQIMGIQRAEWGVAKLFPRDRYVDNWFVRTWSRGLQDQLFKQAGSILFIHRDAEVRSRFTSRIESLNLSCNCLEMSNWEQADSVIEQAAHDPAPLVLFSGGPANKCIGPRIASGGGVPKVVIDLGQAAAKEWT